MAKKQFKAESKRLLDLMINSIYTHKEIFLRELISNASDAIDKLYYKSLTEKINGISRDDFFIKIKADKENKTLTISDNGMGMTKEELESNLGTIAKSGSLIFEKNEDDKAAKEIDIIGQFGVGFYSAFMVSSEVKVISKAYDSDQAYEWKSKGADGYSIKEIEKSQTGTDIILTVKDDTKEEKYSSYLDQYTIKSLVKRYSDYIRYPIKMDVEKERTVDDGGNDDENKEPKIEKFIEEETLNSMVPIWKRSKKDLKDEDYDNFYMEKFGDFEKPLKVVHSNVEGVVSYDALLFLPGRTPFNYYTKDYEKGLQLYSSGVLIMDKCPDLLPDYFGFVKGLVDSQDLSLNISREMLQHDRQLKAIAQRIEKKISSELENMLKKDRETYEKFYENFGLQLKFGVYDNYGMNKEKLQDLLLFYSSSQDKLTTLSEYVDRMKTDQEFIYYAKGENLEKIKKMPQTELLKDRGYEILYCTDDVDEFAFKVLMLYKDKKFKSVSEGELGIEETEEEKKAMEETAEKDKDLLEAMTKALEGKVKKVTLSQRLKDHPVCIVSGGDVSLEMEKIINAMPTDEKVSADKILEINANHSILKALEKAYTTDSKSIDKYAGILYNQALLMEGLPIEDPVGFSNSICELIKEKE